MRATRIVGWCVAAAVAVAACDGLKSTGSSEAREKHVEPAGPSLAVGSPNTVGVHCPAKMETGQSATCAAFAYDNKGYYSPGTVTWSGATSGVVSPTAWGTHSVSATIGGITGSTGITVGDTQNPVVAISAPSSIPPGSTGCFWTAYVTNHGKPNYTYTWSATGATGTASGSDWTLTSTPSSSFTLSVTATDVDGRTGSTSKTISISSQAFQCPI